MSRKPVQIYLTEQELEILRQWGQTSDLKHGEVVSSLLTIASIMLKTDERVTARRYVNPMMAMVSIGGVYTGLFSEEEAQNLFDIARRGAVSTEVIGALGALLTRFDPSILGQMADAGFVWNVEEQDRELADIEARAAKMR